MISKNFWGQWCCCREGWIRFATRDQMGRIWWQGCLNSWPDCIWGCLSKWLFFLWDSQFWLLVLIWLLVIIRSIVSIITAVEASRIRFLNLNRQRKVDLAVHYFQLGFVSISSMHSIDRSQSIFASWFFIRLRFALAQTSYHRFRVFGLD